MRVPYVLAILFLAFGASAIAAPRYASSELTLNEMLKKHDAAVGVATIAAPGRIEEWTLTSSGMTGTEHDVYRGKDYRQTLALGPFLTQRGRYQGDEWEQGENGYTLHLSGYHQRTAVNERALADPSAPESHVSLLGRTESPLSAYVLELAPADGRKERQFYDSHTFQLVRREAELPGRTLVSTYGDFRVTNGKTEPWRIDQAHGHPENDQHYQLVSKTAPAAISDAEVGVPGTRREVVVFPTGVNHVRLPARIDRGRILVRVTIDGRGLDFQLDSGASGIVIDRDVARSLGLELRGRRSQTIAGTVQVARTVIPQVSIGDLTMRGLVVEALPFHHRADFSTRVVGLLGFDFLAGGMFKLDYQHGTVDAYRYDTLDLPVGSVSLDAVLDDSVPVIGAKINGVRSDRFVLDTGADDFVIFRSFALANPTAITDHSNNPILSRYLSSIRAEGVGGKIDLRGSILQHVQVGPIRFDDYLAMITTGRNASFEYEDIDGLIGSRFLRAFDVYLDYSNSRVAFVVNEESKRRSHSAE